MNDIITLRWNTGSMELVPAALLTLNAAQLSRIVKQATINAEEVKAEIAGYIQDAIDCLNPKSEYDKKTIAQYKKLIAACGDSKPSKQEKALARIVKNIADSRPQFCGVIRDAGKYCVLDGYRLVRLSAPIKGIDDAPGAFETGKAIGDRSRYTVRLELPTVQEIKADIKLAKLAGKDVNHIRLSGSGRSVNAYYDFGYGLPMVEAKYLIDMIEALPDAIAYYDPEHALCNPIYFDGGEDDGILLPVRKHEERLQAPEEKPIEKPVEAPATIESEAEKELEAERERRRYMAEQAQIEREKEIADELAQAEKEIMSSGYIENKNLDGKLLFLRLFDKYGIRIPPRSRGWIDKKLASVLQYKDGSAEVTIRAKKKGEKTSQGFVDAYYELREKLIQAEEEYETAIKESTPVEVSADTPAPVAHSAPVQAAHDTTAPEAVRIVTAISPTILRLFLGLTQHGAAPGRNGQERTQADRAGQSGVSTSWTVDGKTVCNTS